MTRFLFCLAFLLTPVLGMAQVREADAFLRGPEHVGQVRQVAGTVIGVHPGLERTCYVVLADQINRPQAQGLGGGGRFFLCGQGLNLTMGQAWKGTVKQTGTRQARVGPRFRVLPLFEKA